MSDEEQQEVYNQNYIQCQVDDTNRRVRDIAEAQEEAQAQADFNAWKESIDEN